MQPLRGPGLWVFMLWGRRWCLRTLSGQSTANSMGHTCALEGPVKALLRAALATAMAVPSANA